VVSDASFGSAILAGVGIGIYPDLKKAVEICSKIEKIYKPEKKNTDFYDDLFKIYLEIHDKTASIYKKMASFTGKGA